VTLVAAVPLDPVQDLVEAHDGDGLGKRREGKQHRQEPVGRLRLAPVEVGKTHARAGGGPISPNPSLPLLERQEAPTSLLLSEAGSERSCRGLDLFDQRHGPMLKTTLAGRP
jgi:hypothetical protein